VAAKMPRPDAEVKAAWRGSPVSSEGLPAASTCLPERPADRGCMIITGTYPVFFLSVKYAGVFYARVIYGGNTKTPKADYLRGCFFGTAAQMTV